MAVRYRVTLTLEERKQLEDITKRGKHSAQKISHARSLLLCDTSDNRITRTVESVADAVGVSCRTIEHLKQRFVEEGIDSALTRKSASKPPREIRFDGAFEAKLITPDLVNPHSKTVIFLDIAIQVLLQLQLKSVFRSGFVSLS